MITLKAKETLSLEGGRVLAGETFKIKSKEEAAVLIARDQAEEADGDDEDEDKAPAKPVDPRVRETKPKLGPTETK